MSGRLPRWQPGRARSCSTTSSGHCLAMSSRWRMAATSTIRRSPRSRSSSRRRRSWRSAIPSAATTAPACSRRRSRSRSRPTAGSRSPADADGLNPMPLDEAAAKTILAQIDRDELARLGCDLTSIPSPTGEEKAIAEFILGWFETNGIKAVRQEVEVDRPNAVGILKGDGTGLSLSFNGHMDTSFTGTNQDARMASNLEPEAELKGRSVGDNDQ